MIQECDNDFAPQKSMNMWPANERTQSKLEARNEGLKCTVAPLLSSAQVLWQLGNFLETLPEQLYLKT
jgi:hypothetical protein